MAAQNRQSSHKRREESLFLPSFCAIRILFAVILVAQILSFLLVLASPNPGVDVWTRLGLVSFFVQWIALSSAAVLCMARPLLSRFSNVAAALVSYLLLLLVTAIISEIGFLVLYRESMLSLPAGDHFRFLLRNMTISALISAVALRYFYIQHQWKEQVRAEARARIQALQSRIRPHFLFNSLNTIASLTAISAEQTEEAVEDLAELFRMTMRDSDDRVSLVREIEIAQRYLRMESLRLGERLRIEWELEDIPNVEVPALILQPLLENAIYHGVEPLPDGGCIKVNIGRQGRQLKMEVENPVASGTGHIHHRGNRLAHENIRERLRLAFGHAAGLVIESGESLYRVSVRLPLEPVL